MLLDLSSIHKILFKILHIKAISLFKKLNKIASTVHFHILIFVPFSFSPYAVSMWTMARHQVAAPWTQWPARAQASSCRPILSTANGESRSSTAPTVTTTSPPSLCPETPPLPVTCECMLSLVSPKPSWNRPYCAASLNLSHGWMFIRPGLKSLKSAKPIALALVGSVHDQQLIV